MEPTVPTVEASTELTTRSGLGIVVRPAQPGDEQALRDFFATVSREDLRFRFLTAVQRVDDEQINAMTHTNHRNTDDFLVTDLGSGQMVANAMLAADERLDTAEVAISIHRDWKGRGIGWAVLEHVCKVAKQRGIKRLQSIEARENHQAIELEREMGFVARPLDGDPTLILLEARLD